MAVARTTLSTGQVMKRLMRSTLAKYKCDVKSRMSLRPAVVDRIIKADPSAGVPLHRRRKAAAAMTIPAVEEVGRAARAPLGDDHARHPPPPCGPRPRTARAPQRAT